MNLRMYEYDMPNAYTQLGTINVRKRYSIMAICK